MERENSVSHSSNGGEHEVSYPMRYDNEDDQGDATKDRYDTIHSKGQKKTSIR